MKGETVATILVLVGILLAGGIAWSVWSHKRARPPRAGVPPRPDADGARGAGSPSRIRIRSGPRPPDYGTRPRVRVVPPGLIRTSSKALACEFCGDSIGPGEDVTSCTYGHHHHRGCSEQLRGACGMEYCPGRTTRS